jgi:serine/threonine-protein kinase RsbT
VARCIARELAAAQGLRNGAAWALATAVSEVARNIVVHAGRGEIVLAAADSGGRRGVVAIARDEGRGIPDVERALEDGYSTAGGLGLGLPAARRLVDEFTLESVPGAGTTVILKKWGE